MIGVWFTVFPLLFAIPLSGIISATFPKEPDRAKIMAHGTDAPGRVRRTEPVYNETFDGVHPERVYFTYLADGKTSEGTMDTLSLDTVTNWRAGDVITVRYLNGEATIPDLQAATFPTEIFVAMPLLFALIGLPFLIYAVAGALGKRKLLMFGDVRRARLLSMVPVQSFGMFGSAFLKTRFETNYTYLNDANEEIYSKSYTSDLVLLNEKKKGDEIEILVAPARTKQTLVVDSKVRKLLALDF
jgi:hypothetical protein